MPMPRPDIPETADNSPLDADERATLHRMAHQVDDLYRRVAPFLPVADAYMRGGMLAARTALKRLRP